jgi:hypothetical protein
MIAKGILSMVSSESLIDALQGRAATLRRLGYRVRLDVAVADGVAHVLLDAADGRFEVSPADAETEADTVLRLAAADLAKMMEGRLSPMLAFSTGRLRVEGSRGVALKLAGLLEEE